MDTIDAIFTLGVASVFVVPLFAGRAFSAKRGDGAPTWRGYPPLWLGIFKATTAAACAAWLVFILSVYPGCSTTCFFLGLPALAATTPLAAMAYVALLLRGKDSNRP